LRAPEKSLQKIPPFLRGTALLYVSPNEKADQDTPGSRLHPLLHRNGNTLTQAFSRIEASQSAAKVRVADAFKNEAGAFDLPSILVGVVVVGVLTAGVLASIFGVIPFAQDKGAQQDLGAITTAQGVYKAQGTTGVEPGTKYGADLAALQTANLVGQGITNVAAAGDNDEWAAASKSNSGTYFVVSSKNTTPVDVTAVDIDSVTAGVQAPANVADALKAAWIAANANTGTSALK
jgi:type II secretory pathway pseudopilin PulG